MLFGEPGRVSARSFSAVAGTNSGRLRDPARHCVTALKPDADTSQIPGTGGILCAGVLWWKTHRWARPLPIPNRGVEQQWTSYRL